MLLVLALAASYQRFGRLRTPMASLRRQGGIVAIVVQALWGLAGQALRQPRAAVVAAAVAALSLWGVNEVALLFGASLASPPRGSRAGRGGARRRRSRGRRGRRARRRDGRIAADPPGVALIFLKVGSVLFGSGYVLLAFLRADLVERRHG